MNEERDHLYAEVERLRDAGKPGDALAALWGFKAGHRDPGFVKRHFVGRPRAADQPGVPCLLLEAARRVQTTAGSTFSEQPPFNEKFDSFVDQFGTLLGEPGRSLLALRGKLVRLRKKPQFDTIGQELANVWSGYEQAWGIASGGEGRDPVPNRFAETRPLDGSLAECFNAARKHNPALNPASPVLPFLLDSLRYLWGEELPVARLASTWIALTGREQRESANNLPGPEYRDGRLARLVVEAVPGGSGRLYPHPLYAGYLATDAVFQQSLATAARVFADFFPGYAGYDFRWTVHVWEPTDPLHTGLPVVLTGPSAGAAFYCAMRAAATGETLDPRAVVTAAIKDRHSGQLGPVGGVSDKLTGLARERSDADWQRVDTVVVAASQVWEGAAVPEEGRKVSIRTWDVTVRPAQDLESAYTALTAQGRIARRIKEGAATRARAILQGPDALCDTYIWPRLSTKVPSRDERGLPKETQVDLSTDQRDALLRAAWPLPTVRHAARVRILADSGMGKSTLLTAAELLLGEAPSGPVPLRLGAGPRGVERVEYFDQPLLLGSLSEFCWSAEPQDLVEQFLPYVQDLAPDLNDEDLRSWLTDGIRRGDVAFLLDAIDQTSESFSLKRFLSFTRRCPVIVTGRPTTKESHRDIWGEADWTRLDLEPFGEQDVREYCGEELADRLLKNTGLKDLVFVPVLLQLLCKLDRAGQLAEFKNREAIYDATMTMLQTVGQKTAVRNSVQHLTDPLEADRIQHTLAQVAWNMWQAAGLKEFTGELAGTPLKAIFDAQPNLREELLQINAVTLRTYFDHLHNRQHHALAWRHFSYAEWFAGQHLATLAASAQDWGDPGNVGEAERYFQVHARTGRPWVFRFALSAADRRGEREAVNRMARWLLAYGNPFLLTDAVETDGVVLDEALDRLRNWLVFQNRFAKDWEIKKARQTTVPPQPELDEVVVELLDRMFELDAKKHIPLYRDGRWLPGAWELVEAGVAEGNTICVQVRDRFLGEFETRVGVYRTLNTAAKKQAWLKANRGLLQLVPEECRKAFELPLSRTNKIAPVTQNEVEEVRRWTPKVVVDGAGVSHRLTYEERRDRFNALLKERGVDWCLCPPQGWERPDGKPANQCVVGSDKDSDNPRKRWEIPDNYWLQRTPTTNLQYEAFDPHHGTWARRADWNRSEGDFEDTLDNHPVIEVSWYQARMFCVWLTGRGTFGQFSLPREWDWEACARAGRDGPTDEFGIPWTDGDLKEHFDSLSSREANFDGNHPFGKAREAEKGPNLAGTCSVGGIPGREYPANGFGLVDMHGQVLEWQRNLYTTPDVDASPERISNVCCVRGGYWYFNASLTRASFRNWYPAAIHNYNVGLRCVRTP